MHMCVDSVPFRLYTGENEIGWYRVIDMRNVQNGVSENEGEPPFLVVIRE